MRLSQVLFPKRSTDIIIDYCLKHREKTYMPTTRFNKPCLTIIIIIMMMMIMLIKIKKKIGRIPKETAKVSTVHSQRQFIFHLYLSFNILHKNII